MRGCWRQTPECSRRCRHGWGPKKLKNSIAGGPALSAGPDKARYALTSLYPPHKRYPSELPLELLSGYGMLFVSTTRFAIFLREIDRHLFMDMETHKLGVLRTLSHYVPRSSPCMALQCTGATPLLNFTARLQCQHPRCPHLSLHKDSVPSIIQNGYLSEDATIR